MYQRIVCFKFKAGTDEAAIRAHMESFAALEAAIPQILSYRAGRTVPGGENDPAPAYDSMHYATFGSVEDLDTYFYHDAHQQFIADNEAIWADVLVLNAEIDA